MAMSKTPCIVITRDRVSYTRLCVTSLERYAELLDIFIVDHGSTWPAMLDYLDSSPHPTWRLGDRPPHALWTWNELGSIVGRAPYLVTDPDVVFDDGCPGDWLMRLDMELRATSDAVKIGLGLRIDDLPDTPLGEKVRAWESMFWRQRTWTKQAWRAPVDTTLALYRSLGIIPGSNITPAVRLDVPYLLRHLPWYGELDEEESQYYRARLVPGSSHWANGGES